MKSVMKHAFAQGQYVVEFVEEDDEANTNIRRNGIPIQPSRMLVLAMLQEVDRLKVLIRELGGHTS